MTPREYQKDLFGIDFHSLLAKGVKLIMIDVDNTIMPSDQDAPSIRVVHLFQEIRHYDCNIVLIANGVQTERMKKIAEILNVQVYYGVCKPFTFVIEHILDEYQVRPEHAVFIGDQIMSDILCGNILSMHTILVERCDHPFSTNDTIGILQHTKSAVFDRVIHDKL
jgi:HAD superfamily phosphatase (TIGR01668 family)